MKISKIETKVIDIEFFHGHIRKQLFVRITTDDGLTGIGEAWTGAPPQPVEAAITSVFKPLLLGKNSSEIEHLWQTMYKFAYRYGTEGVIMCAISGIDLALWDLLGKRHRVPVANLLGAKVKNRVRVYASFPALRDVRLLTENLHKIQNEGFTGVKLHDLDEKLIALARDVLGDKFSIMLDPSGAWSMAKAEEMARRLEKYQLLWIEEPLFPMQDHRSLNLLRNNTNATYAAGENEFNLAGYQRLMESGAVHYIQPELSKMGGLTAARKVADLAESLGYTLCPHCYTMGPAFYSALQLGSTSNNMDWHELKWLPSGLQTKVVSPVNVIDGHVELPDRPGLGFIAGSM